MTHIFKIRLNRSSDITVLSANLKREGDRGVDQLEFTTIKTQSLITNDRVEVLYDIIPLDGLSLFFGFQGGVKDESTNVNHGTATDITYQSENSFFGDESIFNGTSSFVSVSDSNDLDLSGEFDIFIWSKWQSTAEQFLLSKRSSTSNGFALSVNSSTAGKVKFMIGSDNITSSSSTFNDGNKHLIRIKRDSNNLITLYVDDTSVGTVTSTYDPTNTNSLLIGKDFSGSFFNGNILRLRIYKGESQTTTNATKIFTKVNPRTLLKFGGYITKIDISLEGRRITAQSYGKILAEKDVRGQNYDNKTVEYIMNDLIINNTSFTFNDRNQPTGLTVSKFLADGKLVDILRDFASYANRIFYTTPNEEFFFEPINFNYISTPFIHGTSKVLIESTAFDDSQLINSVTLLGEILEYTTTETFNGDGNTKIFTLLNTTTTLNVKVGGTEKQPEIDYETDTLNKQITFTTAPATGTNNISVEYSYEKPLTIKGEKPSSIESFGVHSKKFNLSWINNRNDGVRFVQSYLNRYSKVNQNIVLVFGSPILYLNENDVLSVENDFLNISGDFAIKSIVWTFPELSTVITVGEYRFNFFENDKEIVRKLHDYESALSKSKEIQEYESPEEILNLLDIIIQYIEDTYVETLNITDTTVIYDKPNGLLTANYGFSSYGSRTSGSVYSSA